MLPLGSADLVGLPGLLASFFGVPWKLVLVALAAENMWTICESGTGAPRKCRLLDLMVPFLCRALDPT